MKLQSSDPLRSSLLTFTITCLLLLIAVAPTGGSLAYGGGKTESKKDGGEFFDKDLATVSYGLALLQANARYMNEAECYVRQLGEEALKEKVEIEATGTNPSLKLRAIERNEEKEWKEWCAVFVDIAEDTNKIIQSALQTKTVPSEGFMFYAWRSEYQFDVETVEDKASRYRRGKIPPGPAGEPVGLFVALEDCQVAEARIRDLDNGTRPCRPWKNSWLARATAPEEKPKETLDLAKAVWGGLSTLVSAGAIYLMYSVATGVYSSTTPRSKKQRRYDYFQSFGFVLLCSFFMWGLYGSHFEQNDDSDPIHSTGSLVQDFKPTDKERNEHGITVLLTMLFPIWLGVKKAHDQTPMQGLL